MDKEGQIKRRYKYREISRCLVCCFYDGLDIGDKRQEEGKKTKMCLAITRNYGTMGIALCGMLIHVWD